MVVAQITPPYREFFYLYLLWSRLPDVSGALEDSRNRFSYQVFVHWFQKQIHVRNLFAVKGKQKRIFGSRSHWPTRLVVYFVNPHLRISGKICNFGNHNLSSTLFNGLYLLLFFHSYLQNGADLSQFLQEEIYLIESSSLLFRKIFESMDFKVSSLFSFLGVFVIQYVIYNRSFLINFALPDQLMSKKRGSFGIFQKKDLHEACQISGE